MDYKNKTFQEWLDFLTPGSVARAVCGLAGITGKEIGKTPEQLFMALQRSTPLYWQLQRKTAEWLSIDPEAARCFELMECLPPNVAMTLDQLADYLDIPLETLEMNAVRSGMFVDDEAGNLRPTDKALREGVVFVVEQRKHI